MKKNFPLESILSFLKNQKTFILLDNGLFAKENSQTYIFSNPIAIIKCHQPEKIKATLQKLERFLRAGYYLSGFLSYETGYAFEDKLFPKKQHRFPLVWMGVFKKPVIFDHRRNSFINGALFPPAKKSTFPENYKISKLRLNTTKKRYLSNIKKIKRFIEKGDTYQVNYTIKYKFNFSGSPFCFYQTLRRNQPVSYGAFIKFDGSYILCFSPELFFRKKGAEIFVRPMKGTAQRGITPKADEKIKNTLKQDEKNKAENVMIVDLLRNDLGKISQIGSVFVPGLFNIEQYKTLFQMTSTIKSKLNKNINLLNLFSSLFPSGSVTGSPKIRTMQIIRQLEKEERKIYTGAIGFIQPDKTAVFNVAIRTILLNKHRGEMGVGSGVTYSSDAKSEYEECKLKAQFLTYPQFQLIETMRWSQKEGFFLLSGHLKRLKRSAIFFGFFYNEPRLKQHLKQAVKNLSKAFSYKIRLLLFEDGQITIEVSKLDKPKIATKPKALLSNYSTSSCDPFLYHKTTQRRLYDQEYKKYSRQGFYDVLFKNERGEITEGAISNIFIKKGHLFYTPPLGCGLLGGVFREFFLRQNKKIVKEKILTADELKKADEIYLVNSVRGMVKIRLILYP